MDFSKEDSLMNSNVTPTSDSDVDIPTNLEVNETAVMFLGKALPEAFRIPVIVLGSGVLVSGVVGNVLLLIVMFKHGQSSKVLHVSIANLTIADLLVTLSGLPYFLVDLMLGRHPVISHLYCRVNALVLCVSYSVSILSLLLISLRRYIKICHRRALAQQFTAQRELVLCAGFWLFACVWSAPFSGLDATYSYDSRSRICSPRGDSLDPDYGTIFMMFLLLIPTLCIGYFNAAIFRHWYGSRRKLQKKKKTNKTKTTPRATWQTSLSRSVDNITSMVVGESDLDGEFNDRDWRIPKICTSKCVTDLASKLFVHKPMPDGQLNVVAECSSRSSKVSFSFPRESGHIFQDLAKGFNSNITTTPKHKFDQDNQIPACRHAASCQKHALDAERKAIHVDEDRVETIQIVSERDDRAAQINREITTADETSNISFKTTVPQLRPPETRKGTHNAQKQLKTMSYLCQALDLNRPLSNSLQYDFKGGSACNRMKCLYPSPFCLVHGNWTKADTDRSGEEKDGGDINVESIVLGSLCDQRQRVSRKNLRNLYPSIKRKVNHAEWRREVTRPKKQSSSDLTVVRSLFVITVCLVLFYTPYFINLVLGIIIGDDLPVEMSVASTLLLFTNCAVNWIIYGAMNTAFRKAYIAILQGRCCSTSRCKDVYSPSPPS